MNNTRKSAYLALLTTTIIWGFAIPIIKYSLFFTSSVSFLFWRFLIASLVFLIPLIIKIKKIKIEKPQILQYLLLGFLGTPLTLLLLFWGIERTTAIDSAVISMITPILVIFGGVIFLKEKVTFLERVGIFLVIIGTFIAILQPLLESQDKITSNLFGNTLVFLGSIAWALFTLLLKTEKNRSLNPFILTSSSFILGFIFLLPFYLHQPQTISLQAIPGILYMGIFGSVIAYLTYIWGLSKIEASESTVFTYLQPLFAVPLSIILLHEMITLPFLFGAIFILAGVFASEYRKSS